MEEKDPIEIIISAIEGELGIPCYLMQCDDDLIEPYVIFKIQNYKHTDCYDNQNLSEIFTIDLTLWYTNPKDYHLYQKIIKKLKDEKFTFKYSYDVIDTNVNGVNQIVDKFYGKLMQFKYKNRY